MLKVAINNKEYSVEETKEGMSIGGDLFAWDLLPLSENRFHAIYKDQSFQLDVVNADYQAKTFQIKVNGQVFELTAKDRFDLLLDKLGMSGATAQKMNELKAPMPGLVLEILATPGAEVQKGDKLLILEAMKMENVLKSPGDGVVKAIKVEKGNNVEKNEVLIVFE